MWVSDYRIVLEKQLIRSVVVAFARRTSLGDPAFAPQQEERLHQLLDKHLAKEVTRNLTDVSIFCAER